MQALTECEIADVNGGLTGWTFAGAMFALAGAGLAVCFAPALGAAAGVLAIAAIGANAIGSYADQ